MIDKKLKDNEGQVMVLVILVVALVSMFGTMAVNQIGNQIKSTTKRYEDIQGKYISEAGIERTIKEACNQLNNNLNISNYMNAREHISLYSGTYTTEMKASLKEAKVVLQEVNTHISTNLVIIKIDNINDENDMIENISYMIKDIEMILKESKVKGIQNKIQEDINTSIKYLYKAFNYAQLEKNKNVEELPIINTDAWPDRQENALLVKELIDDEVQDLLKKTNEGWNTVSKEINKYLNWHEDYKAIENKAIKVYSYANVLHTNINTYYSLVYSSSIANPEVKSLLANIEEDIGKILEYIMEMQIDIVNLYVKHFNDSNDINLKQACNNMISFYDDVKNDFIYINRKLGLGDPIIGPEIGTGGGNDGNNGSSTVKKLILKNYKDIFSDYINNIEYRYEIEYEDSESNIVKQIEKDIIINKDSSGNVTSINDIYVNIISSSYEINALKNEKLNYKIKTKVVFKIDIENNFKINYEIQSYQKMS